MKRITWIFLALMICFSLFSQENKDDGKYIFLFIGDGMGLSHINLTQLYLSAMEEKDGFTDLSFTGFPYTAFAAGYATDRIIAGSAAAGTALAAGKMTAVGRISISPDGSEQYVSLASHAKGKEMKAAVISSVSMDHATPASFYAHAQSRNDYFNIGLDLARSDIDFFGGGGLLKPVGTIDNKQVDVWEAAEKNGFFHADTPAEISALDQVEGKVILTAPRLAGGMAMPFRIDSGPDDITLAEITRIAIDRLDNENGFFIMVEGGKIDWACHGNDAATAVQEVQAFSEAVGTAVEFYQRHPGSTTIIVTADHETGGMSIGRAETNYGFYPDKLRYQKMSSEELSGVIDDFRSRSDISADDPEPFLRFLANDFGLGREDRIPLKGEEKAELTEIYRMCMETGEKSELIAKILDLVSLNAGVGWTSSSHTGINIPVFAIGRGGEKFTGMIDQAELSNRIRSLMD